MNLNTLINHSGCFLSHGENIPEGNTATSNHGSEKITIAIILRGKTKVYHKITKIITGLLRLCSWSLNYNPVSLNKSVV